MSVVSSLAGAVTPATLQLPEGRLEVRLDRVRVPSAAVLGWELIVDGEQVAIEREPSPERVAPWAWAGSFQPGRHTVGVRVHYSRDLKMLVEARRRVSFTFVAGGDRWIGKEHPVEVRAGTVTRLGATLDENPEAISDQLVMDLEHYSLPACEQMPCLLPSGARAAWSGEFEVSQLVQERAAWTTSLVARQLVRAAGGHEGEAKARIAVDERGYLKEVLIDSSTGSEVLDRNIPEVLRLAEPYPVFEGHIAVTLPFWTLTELPRSPMWKLPVFKRGD